MDTRKPSWWQVYALAPILFVLTIAAHLARLPGSWEQIVDGAVVILAFAAVLLWIQINGGLLEHYEMEPDEPWHNLEITVYEPESERKKYRELSHGPSHADSPKKWVKVSTRLGGDAMSPDPEEEEKWSLN